MEIRITKLESQQYDTKPIWERALAEIAELRSQVQTDIEGLRNDLRSEYQAGTESLRNDLRSEFQAGTESLRNEMKAEFATVRYVMEHELRGVARKIDALNQSVLQIQADQRYVDRRLEYLETQTRST